MSSISISIIGKFYPADFYFVLVFGVWGMQGLSKLELNLLLFFTDFQVSLFWQMQVAPLVPRTSLGPIVGWSGVRSYFLLIAYLVDKINPCQKGTKV